MDTAGPDHDRWNKARVDLKISTEITAHSTLVLPLATIIETGNHIAQAPSLRFERANDLAKVMADAADERSPWAAFSAQEDLWKPIKLKRLAQEWPRKAAGKLSIGDATIIEVARLYADIGYHVEILTGDQGLKYYEPETPLEIPRRRKTS